MLRSRLKSACSPEAKAALEAEVRAAMRAEIRAEEQAKAVAQQVRECCLALKLHIVSDLISWNRQHESRSVCNATRIHQMKTVEEEERPFAAKLG